MSPSEYPRPTSRDGVETPDTQPNTTGKISITTLIRIRQEKIIFSFQNKKVLLPGRDARNIFLHPEVFRLRECLLHANMTAVLCFWSAFYTPGPSFVFSSINAPTMYHIPGAGKGLV